MLPGVSTRYRSWISNARPLLAVAVHSVGPLTDGAREVD
jgi:hypothetical protein